MTSARPEPLSRGGSRLLVIEDDPALRDLLARAFGERGFVVEAATTVQGALAHAGSNPPDYAIVDLRLPDGSGLTIVSKLIALNPKTQIVVLTGYGSIASAVEAIKLGATQYLMKPVTVDDLVAAFERQPGRERTAPTSKPMSIRRLEWEHIERVLFECNGNVSAAARAMSMHRRTLQRKLAKRPVRA